MAALAASWWTNWCLHSLCVPMSDVFDVAAGNQVEPDPPSPGWRGCESMTCWCGIGKKDDKGKKWEVLRTIQLASCQNRICSNQHVRYTQDASCREWMQVGGVSHYPAICRKSVRCCFFVYRDTLQCTTAKIAWMSDINRTLFEGTDVWWCLSQIIPGILHETDTNNQVMW